MLSPSTLLVAATALLGLTAAAPNQIRSTGIVHRIYAGSKVENDGLHFEPQNVVAGVGDMIEFHFLPKNHSVVQSSFDAPCTPLEGGIFSGFNFATADGEAPNVFTMMVRDDKPFWYYCSQVAGNHCQTGMSGVINQNFTDNEKTLAKYKVAAVGTVTGQPSADPKEMRGGYMLPNVLP
jgi:plastocyanin